MTRAKRDPIPDEHLDADLDYRLKGHRPTRLSGSRKTERSLDPYHQVFPGPGQDVALSFDDAAAACGTGSLRLPSAYLSAPGLSPRAIALWPNRDAVLRLLGVLCSWRAVTNNQAAALTGHIGFADPRSDIVSRLFRAGLINIASPYLGQSLGLAGDQATVYTLGDRRKVSALLNLVPYSEWLAVTGGKDLPRVGPHIRHDVLGTELALLAAEELSIGTVLGPHFSTFPDLLRTFASESNEDRVRVYAARSAKGGPDLVIVRSDGLRIAVEVTATMGVGFRKKVARWAEYIETTPFEQTGLVVVFLAAPTLTDRRKRGDWPRGDIYEAVASDVRRFPGSARDRTANRMGVATWMEWFPDTLLTSERFLRLRVDRPTGQDPPWEPCDLLDPDTLPVSPNDTRSLRAVIPASALLAQTPPFLQHGHRVADLSTDLLRAAVGEVRTIAPLRERSREREVGHGQGAAGDAYIPPRLLGPTCREAPSAHQLITGPPHHPAQWADRAAPPPRVREREVPVTQW